MLFISDIADFNLFFDRAVDMPKRASLQENNVESLILRSRLTPLGLLLSRIVIEIVNISSKKSSLSLNAQIRASSL